MERRPPDRQVPKAVVIAGRLAWAGHLVAQVVIAVELGLFAGRTPPKRPPMNPVSYAAAGLGLLAVTLWWVVAKGRWTVSIVADDRTVIHRYRRISERPLVALYVTWVAGLVGFFATGRQWAAAVVPVVVFGVVLLRFPPARLAVEL